MSSVGVGVGVSGRCWAFVSGVIVGEGCVIFFSLFCYWDNLILVNK